MSDSVAGWPISSRYGPRARGDGFHDGVDVDCAHGTELAVPYHARLRLRDDPETYGWLYDVHEIGGDHSMRWAHLSKRLFPDGARVADGTIVAHTGGRRGALGAGNSTGDHLHCELRIAGRLVDPMTRPRLLASIFTGGLQMTKDEIRDIIEQEQGQMLVGLAEEFERIGAAHADKQLLRMGRAMRAAGNRKLESGRT